MPKEAPKEIKGSIEFTPADRLCVWMTDGRRCTMAGEGSFRIGGGGQQYCAWHMLLLQSPRWGDDYQEFERYCLSGRGRSCGQWTHYPPPLLWDCVQGLATYVGHKPVWCWRMDCRHFDVREIARMAREKPVPDVPSRRDGRSLAAAVSGRMALEAMPGKPAEQQKAELRDWVKRHEAKQDEGSP